MRIVQEENMAAARDGSRAVWFLTGAALGAAIALLYAPQSGEQTRRMIGQKAREGRDALSEHGEEWVDRGKELYERGRKVADEAAEMFERGRKLVEG
jgi:gas vesicle protein